MHIPIKLQPNSNILISGAGGGFDFLCGLPIASTLIENGHSVVFSNYSFTKLKNVKAEKVTRDMTRITYQSDIFLDTYYPEGYFTRWYKFQKEMDMPVYCYGNIGVKPLVACIETIREMHYIDTIFVMDGGVDGIFRGDEFELGTPSMDSISMISANESNIPNKYYVMTAFGSEGVHNEVAHAEVLLRISDLMKMDGYYGISALLKNDVAAKDFVDASRYIFKNMPRHQHSNIVCSLLKALDGAYGYTAVNDKTELYPIWLSALTSMYWFFDLDKAARLKLFYDQVIDTERIPEVSNAIERFRNRRPEERPGIPL